MDRKPNSNAALKNLPEERQQQIAAWCAKDNDLDPATGKPIPLTGGLAHAQAQLLADGQKVSLPVLSEFYRWWKARQRHLRNLSVMEQVRELAEQVRPGDAQFMREAVEITMLARASESESPQEMALAAKLHDDRRSLDLSEKSAQTKARQKDAQIQQKDRDLKLSERRVAVLEAKAAEAEKAANDATLSDAEKAARIREIFGK